MLSRIQPSINYSYKSNLSSRPSAVSAQYRPQAKQITFGDGDCVSTYDYEKAMRDLKNSKTPIEGETPENAFSNFYKAIIKKLSSVSAEEDSKIAAHGKASRDYDVVSNIPISEEKYVKSMSGFVRQYGTQPKISDSGTAIGNHITNVMGIPKSKWWQSTEFDKLKTMMSITYDYLKEGLVSIKSLK